MIFSKQMCTLRQKCETLPKAQQTQGLTALTKVTVLSQVPTSHKLIKIRLQNFMQCCQLARL